MYGERRYDYSRAGRDGGSDEDHFVKWDPREEERQRARREAWIKTQRARPRLMRNNKDDLKQSER